MNERMGRRRVNGRGLFAWIWSDFMVYCKAGLWLGFFGGLEDIGLEQKHHGLVTVYYIVIPNVEHSNHILQ